ncbi:hypothetical protein OEZ86_013935 [Tetradesmus obliquus]|nr:hypothetical protein OEZ86_013935 [Tetradesmus obliquus]
MLTLAGGCRLLTHQQLQPRLALLLLALSLAASLPVLQGSSEVFKYGDDPEFAGNDTGTHWTYGLAGEDWAGSEPDGSTWLCQSGQQQSPVNLPTSPDAAAPLDASHKASWQLGSLTANGSNVGVANNGHNVQVSWQDPSFEPYLSLVVQAGQPLESCLTLRPGHKTATVKAVPQQLHFHTHSEHLLGGRIFPLEAHLVSLVEQSQLPSCPPGGCVVVTAVLFELGDNLTQDNAWLAPLFEAMPYSEGESSHLPAGTRFDLQQLLPPNSSYIAYGGSLTTPPCSEGVTWLVMLEPQPLSLKQRRDFMKAVGDYNCTLNGSTSDAGSINGTAPAPRLLFESLEPGNTTQQGNYFINYRPQDTDDALATIMALNHPSLDVLSIIPIFGSSSSNTANRMLRHFTQQLGDSSVASLHTHAAAPKTPPHAPIESSTPTSKSAPSLALTPTADLASEMLVTQWLVGQLKQRPDIPVVPGAISPPVPLLIQPAALYWDNSTDGQPLKACLLARWPDLAKQAVEAVVFLSSQPADAPMTLNGGPSPPDFNVFMEPLAAAVLLHAAAAAGVQLVLLHWSLTSLGTTAGQNIVVDSSMIRPQPGLDPPIPASTHWLRQVQAVRLAAGFEGPNAVPPGPFDQYVIQYIIDPSAFSCKPLPVYMQQCSPAPWLHSSSSSSSSDDSSSSSTDASSSSSSSDASTRDVSSSSSSSSSEPFNAGGDCPGHGPGTTARNRQQPAMMLVDLTDTYTGPLIAGSGLLPSFGAAPALRATVCYGYAPDGGRQKFVDNLAKWTW